MRLVVVESPAKCRKIESYLGEDFRVVASMGHFRDLPSQGIGVDLSSMTPHYIITKQEVVDRLSKLAQNADCIYLCTDPDREGEAISWHLSQIFPPEKPTYRATFQEITKKAIQKAIANPTKLHQNLVDAQQARRILDRIVGYKLSPELWRAFSGRGALSAGRVQSVATRLIVDREREIEAFVESVSYKVVATLDKKQEPFQAELKGLLGEDGKVKKVQFKELPKAQALVDLFKKGIWTVTQVQLKKQKVTPQPPFTTSNMQAKAAYVLKMSAAKSMQLAQKLYESGHISYHRTDSVAISDDAQSASRDLIRRTFGPEYLPDQAPKYKNSGNAQEAHECIRPTQIDHKTIEGVSADEQKLYRLIWDQFISSQMSAGEDAVTVVDIAVDNGLFEARGRMEVFDGFRKLNRTEVEEKSHKKKDEEDLEKQKLPTMAVNDILHLQTCQAKEVKTRPPPRYSEASLIKKLEKEGIGRPSTYASIVATIVKRSYVELESRKYYATNLGKDVTDFLVGRFPKVLELGFTKACEDRLDKIALGEIDYREFLIKFWAYLSQQIANPPAQMSKPADTKPADPPQPAPKTEAQSRGRKKSDGRGKPSQAQAQNSSVTCPSCGQATKFQPSAKWEGRFFHCCHSCRSYLEAHIDGSLVKGAEWILPKE